VQDRFGENDRASYGRKVNRRVRRVSSSCEVKKLSFAVFHDEACIEEDFRHDIVTTK